MSSDRIIAHLQVDTYGDFQLTDAIRPSLDLAILPCEGYRRDKYKSDTGDVPLLVASVSKENLFDLFLDLLQPLGEQVDVVLETSHDLKGGQHRDLHREGIDMPVLLSYFYEHEDLLINDGCTGVAVMASNKPMEIQFDEHKLLIVYAASLKPFEKILRRAGLERNDKMKLLTEAEHLHSTDARHREAFEQLACQLGACEPAEWVR